MRVWLAAAENRLGRDAEGVVAVNRIWRGSLMYFQKQFDGKRSPKEAFLRE
jgi:hypothetical protein